MRTSCVSHPKNAPLLVIHQWQHDLFQGDTAAAALASYFEYWHSIKLGAADDAGRKGAKEDLIQYHSEADLEAGILGIAKRKKIRSSMDLLIGSGLVEIIPNQNPLLRTRGFLFNAARATEYAAYWGQIYHSDNGSQGKKYPRCVLVPLTETPEESKRPRPSGQKALSKRSKDLLRQMDDSADLPKGQKAFCKRSKGLDLKITDPEIPEIKEIKEGEVFCFSESEPDPEAIATLPKESWIARPDPEPGTVEVSKPDPKTLSAPRSIKTNVDSSNGSGLRGVKVPPPRVSPQDSSEKVGQFIPTAENFFGPRKQDLAYRFPRHYGAQRYGALALAHFEVPHYWVGPGAWDYAPELIKGAELHLRSLNRPAEQKDCSKWISTRVGNLSKPQESAAALLALEHAYAEGERWSKAIAAYEAARMPVEVPQSIAEGDRLPDSSGGDSGAPRGAGKLDLSGLDRIIKGGGLRLDSRVAAEEVRCA